MWIIKLYNAKVQRYAFTNQGTQYIFIGPTQLIILTKYPVTEREQTTQYSEAETPQTSFANYHGDPLHEKCPNACKANENRFGCRNVSNLLFNHPPPPPTERHHGCNTNGIQSHLAKTTPTAMKNVADETLRVCISKVAKYMSKHCLTILMCSCENETQHLFYDCFPVRPWAQILNADNSNS